MTLSKSTELTDDFIQKRRTQMTLSKSAELTDDLESLAVVPSTSGDLHNSTTQNLGRSSFDFRRFNSSIPSSNDNIGRPDDFNGTTLLWFFKEIFFQHK